MRRLVVAGYGMVGHKLVETLVERGATSDWEIVVFAEEPRPAYDRVNLSRYFTRATEVDRAWAGSARTGVVVGGGLLGLEAANALRSLGLATHVVECAPRLMPAQVDEGGAFALRRRIEELGVTVRTASQAIEVVPNEHGAVSGLRFGEGRDLDADLVVFSAGIRPRDELGRAAGLEMGGRGGIVVDDGCRTSDPRIYAIGECALAA